MTNIKNLYKELVKTFLIENNIKEVICINTKELFFDKIVVTDKENRIIKVYSYGLPKTTWDNLYVEWDNLYLDFTCDYAQCIAEMEHDLYQQKRNMQHNNYKFIFDED